MTNKIDYSKILEVQIRDGVARQDSPVWWHCDEGAMFLNSEHDWRNLVEYPLVYSLEKPTFKMDDYGYAIYDYEDPYGD